MKRSDLFLLDRAVGFRLPLYLENYYRRVAERSHLPLSKVLRIVLDEERKRMGKKVRVILKGKK